MRKLLPFIFGIAFLLSACATDKTNWQSRIGSYTYDQAVIELGPPDKEAKLTDGTKVAEWLTTPSRAQYGHTTYLGHGSITPLPVRPTTICA
jgi:hypothetical protein